jgi:predicted enzyme related to lactoylglutathione lyase
MSFSSARGHSSDMTHHARNQVVHLELHSHDLPEASSFYEQLFGWRRERFETRDGSYLAIELGAELGGGIVQCPAGRSLWLPYVQVDDVERASEDACMLGASLLLAPREGPVGWRSVLATGAGGEIALWQPKR